MLSERKDKKEQKKNIIFLIFLGWWQKYEQRDCVDWQQNLHQLHIFMNNWKIFASWHSQGFNLAVNDFLEEKWEIVEKLQTSMTNLLVLLLSELLRQHIPLMTESANFKTCYW